MSPNPRESVPVGSVERELRRGSAENELEGCRTRSSVYAGILCVRERSHVHILVTLMLIDVVTKHLRDRPVVAFNLSVRLGVIRGRMQVSYPQDAADRCTTTANAARYT